MNVWVLALAIAALVLAGIDQIMAGGRSLLAWAVIALALAGIVTVL